MTLNENSKKHHRCSQQLPQEDHVKVIENVLGPEEDTLCGIGPCKSICGQFLATPLTYLVLSSTIALIQGLFNTYSNATLSTVEKRYGLPSKLSGFTTTGNDLTQLFLSIPLAYYAGRGHRPRWLAFGMLLAAAGCFIAASPHYLVGGGYLETESSKNINGYLCPENSTSSEVECQSRGIKYLSTHYFVVFIFLLAQMLSGVASLLYYTVGYSYLDDCVSKTNSPLFLSISGGLRLLGPVCGYALASWSLRKWVNPWMISVNIEPSHPGWIGAWWLGYIVIGSALLSMAWLLIMLPKTMPTTRRRRYKEILAASKIGNNTFNEYVCSLFIENKVSFNEFRSSIKRLCSNIIYRLILLNQSLFWFAFFGYITFKSKYLEHQFRMSAADANKYIAGVSLVAALVGFLGTGATLTYFRPRPKLVLTCMAILSLTSMICYVVQGFIFCEHEDSGNHILQNVLNESISSCSLECSCAVTFSPLCDPVNSRSYLNPCVAGCTSIVKVQGKFEYHNCTCVESSASEPVLTSGYCSRECPSFNTYLAFSVIAKLAEAGSRVPLNMLLFRSVEERDKNVGLGVFNAVIALTSSIPSPIIFGLLIDSTCTLWDKSCNENTHCWMNNVTLLRKYIHGIPAIMLALCFLTDLWLLKHNKKLKLYSENFRQEENS